jgi:hypothetical protein
MAKKSGKLKILMSIGTILFSIFKEKENRDKVKKVLKVTNSKFQAKNNMRKINKVEKAAIGNDPSPQDERENNMIDEGAQTTIQYFNESQDNTVDKKTT